MLHVKAAHHGDILVAETAAPPTPKDLFSLRWWAMGFVLVRAGAGVASANRITLLRVTPLMRAA